MPRPGFSVCICPDSMLLRDHVDASLAAHPSPGAGGQWQRLAVWGDEPLADSFWETLSLPDLFGGGTALVLRLAHLIPADTWRRLSSRLARPVDSTWLFLCLEVEFERGEPKVPAHIAKLGCMRFARDKGWVWTNAGLDARGMRDFMRRRAEALGLRFAPGAEAALAAALPADAAAAAAGLEQVALYAAGGEVTADMADLVRREAEMDIFTLVRAFQGGKTGTGGAAVWRQIVNSRLTGDGFVFSLLGILQREARQMWQLLCGGEVRLPPSVIGPKRELARSLGHAGLGRLWDSILQAEFGIKSGERSPDQALDMLTAELFSLFGRAGARR